MAPTGSSSFMRFSTKGTATQIRMPAMKPMTSAAKASTKAQGAVMATRPASTPFAVMDGSGFPNFIHM